MPVLLLFLLAQARGPELLERRCLSCHNEKVHKGDLDLSRRDSVKVPPETIWRSVAHLDEPHMPHKAPKLPPAELDEIRRWIDAGMAYDRPLKSTAVLFSFKGYRINVTCEIEA